MVFFKKKTTVALAAALCLTTLLFLFYSCEVGLGPAVDIAVPTVGISYPPKNAVARDSFIVSGNCNDDVNVVAVSVTLTNPETNESFGPYDAELSEDAKSWTILLNKSDLSKTTDEFDSFEQWDFPDGNYIINAIAYDGSKKKSQIATSPIAIDNTAPVLIVSKPLAIGDDIPTIYGRSLKLSGDIAEDHETSKLVLYYREYDNSSDTFIDSEVKSIEITDSAELNAMSSSNPLILAKYDENKTASDAHKRYLTIYGSNNDNVDRYYYCSFMLEDSALVYQNPGDEGSGHGNQTNQYYLLGSDFQNVLSVNYSLNVTRLKDILKGQSENYDASQIKTITELLSKTGNYASSFDILNEEVTSRNTFSKLSLNPHNNPTWALDEYGFSATMNAAQIKSYSAGSSLILSIKAGRDASYPDPKTVKADFYDLGEYNSNTNYYELPVAGLNPISLIDPQGESKWDESADDSEKTYTFTLNTEDYELLSKHVYRMIVTGTDRNKTDLEPENDYVYLFNLSTSNNSPKITILSPAEDIVLGKAVNETGITITGTVATDAVPLKSKNDGGVQVSSISITNLEDGSISNLDLSKFDCVVESLEEQGHNKYPFTLSVKAKSGETFVPAAESKYYYTVTVRAQDLGDAAPGEKNVKFYVDNKKPEIKIISVTPDDGSGTVNGKIKVSGIAADSGNTGSDLKSISYVIKNSATQTVVENFNNVEIPLNESWSFELATTKLSAGNSGVASFDIIVSAQDKVDNVAVTQKTIVIDQQKDQPVFELSNADKTIAATSSVSSSTNMFPSTAGNKLYGSVKDDDGLGSFVMTCKKVGPGASGSALALTPAKALVPGTKLYDFEYTLPSVEGQYEIFIEAKDIYALASASDSSKKETNYDSLSHKFYVTIDDGAPVFSAVTPVLNEATWLMGSKTGDVKTLVVRGTVSDGNGFASEEGLVTTHTSSLTATPQSVTAKTFIDTITLPSESGKYQAGYKAKDIYGQESEYKIEYSVDVDEPVIDGIIKIGDNDVAQNAESIDSYITQSNISVEVMVKDDDSGVKSVTYTFDNPVTAETVFSDMTHSVLGEEANGDEKWSANITFPDGDDVRFCIRVTDNVGNYIDRTIQTKVDKTKPILEVKGYQIKGADESQDGSILEPGDTAYVNTKDIVLYGNYTDGDACSGIEELVFTIANTGITPEVKYYSQSFVNKADIATILNAKETIQNDQGQNVEINPYEVTYGLDANNIPDEDTKTIKSFVALIDKSSYGAGGDLIVSARDHAGNDINGGFIKIMKLNKDSTPPAISGINVGRIKGQGFKESYKTSDGKFYVRNRSDEKLTITGTTTDNSGIDKTVLTVTGTVDGQADQVVYKEESTQTSWTFTDIDLSSCQNTSAVQDAVITITAFDKAGNTKNADSINLIFDSTAPAVLTNDTDTGDSSNPFPAGYKLRGKDVWKYGGIKIGAGSYSDASFGRETSIALTVTFIGEEGGSGVSTIEYKMLAVSKVTEAYKTVQTGIYTGTVPADAECTTTGTFAIEQGKYEHFNDPIITDHNDPDYNHKRQYDCTLGKGTISGFESTVAGTPNIVFVRGIDNCGNEGNWFALLIQVDDSIPQVVSDASQTNPTSLLTNGKSSLQRLTGKYKDEGAGLKALRLYVDGKVVIDGCLKGLTTPQGATSITISNTDSNKTLTITAEDAHGQVIAPSDNGATKVSFTNNYGTLTYNAYYTNASGTGVPDSFANGPTFADWTLDLTPQNGTWFNALNKSVVQVAIEAEDWAEDASGSGNKASTVITSLDIDKTLPVSAITNSNANLALNGEQTIKGTITENHTPKSLSIYYSTAVDANGKLPDSLKAPAKLDSTDASAGWKLIKSITTASKGEKDPSGDEYEYSATVQKIYNFEVKDVDFNSLIGKDAEGHDKVSGKVHILVCSQDKAGNINWADNDVTKNKKDNSAAYKTFTVDRNSDRPVVTITSTELVTKPTDTTVSPLSDSNYLPLEIKTLNFKVTDDDGVQKVEYRIIKGNENPGWTPINDTSIISTISTNGASIKLTDEGKQKIEFQITDKKGGVFTSVAPANGSALNTIYLADSDNHKYGTTEDGYETPVVYVDVDTMPPVLAIEGVQYLPQGFNELSDTEKAAVIETAEPHTSGFSSVTLGGPDAQYLRVKVRATDAGSGVEKVELSATLDGVELTEKPYLETPSEEGGIYYLVIPVLNGRADSAKKDNSSYVLTVKATDVAGKESSDAITFKLDDKLPVITVNSPASDENLTGNVTIDTSISEIATLYYAISPIDVSPDDYAENQSFAFVTYDSNDNEKTPVNLPTTDKSGHTINPAQTLKELCTYTQFSTTSMRSMYLWFDGKTGTTGHSKTLNQWIKDIGITTDADLSSSTNAFDDIVKLYFHVKAVDQAKNITRYSYPIRLDPLGNRPQVKIGYPSEDKAGGTNRVTLGGSPTIIGTASGTNGIDYAWLQVDCDSDGDWDADDFAVLKLKGYELGYMKSKQVVTTIADNTDINDYAIRIRVSGRSWSQKINIGGELNPASEGETKAVKIWAYATDTHGFTSSPEARNIDIDSDLPVIDQNIRLVQWATNYNGKNGFALDSNDNIQLAANATIASREYIEGERIKGKWYLIGKVTDDSGIHSVSYKVNGGTLIRAIIPEDAADKVYEGSDTEAGAYIRPVTLQKSSGSGYLFCLPIGDTTDDEVGEYSIEFSAEENKDSDARSAEANFTVLYDNKAPVASSTDFNATVVNSDGVYTFGGEATEEKVGTIDQSGVERIAFYFTRDINKQPKKIFDPMIRIGKDGNVLSYKDGDGLTLDSGLYWKTVSVNSVSGSAVTVPADSNLKNVHIGGLAKINGVIYRIEGVDSNVVSLSGDPGAASSIMFAIANVVDNPTRESEGNLKDYGSEYGWGYTKGDGLDDDGDRMIESLIQEGTKYTWEASINSKNISDGPITLNYVVFDMAGNATTVKTKTGVIKNNAPRIAGVKFGTDENGNNEVEGDEFITTYHELYKESKGYNGGSKITSLSLPTNSTAATPVSALKIKGKTVIIPEIIGGNGEIKYTYSVAKRNNGNTNWDDPYFTLEPSKQLRTSGTVDDDDASQNYIWEDSNITLDVKDFITLKNDSPQIPDGKNQKFTFKISDSTPYWDNEGAAAIESQTATIDIVMDVELNDEKSAKNKIIPFYWESANKNSLKNNNSELGHIELSKDLPDTITSKTPKVSGAVKLEGIAQDNILLKDLSVSISTYNSGNPITIATYNNDGSWTGTASITNATYGEFKAAGYIGEIPEGKNADDTVEQVSQEYGHVVHWTMEIDTEAMSITPATNISIKARALDKGKPTLNGENVEYTSNKFDYNETGTIPEGQTEYVEPDPVVQSGGDNGSSAYTYNYTIDVVPYIRGIKTKLSTKSKKSDSSEYDRTAIGHYPVNKSETIYLYGFNLTGGTLYDSAYETAVAADKSKHMASLGSAKTENDDDPLDVFTKYDSYKGFKLYPVSGISTFTSGQVYVKVGDVESLNNKNSNSPDYNCKPNGNNNDTLKDDVKLDVWNINSEAGLPSAGGRIDELTMKINPASNYNGIVGFAFLDGPVGFSRPKGGTTSYTKGKDKYSSQKDSQTTAALAYDTKGNAFSMSAGGNEGDGLHFEILPAGGDDSTEIYLEYVNQNKKRDNSGKYMDLRYKVRSPNIATSPNGVDTNIYMVYYDSFNDEIRYKYGSMNKLVTNIKNKNWSDTDLFRPINNNASSWNNNNPYTCQYSQVIATDATTNLPTTTDAAGETIIDPQYAYTGTPLGGAGEFVDIDVIPKGSTGGLTDEDVVVVVWYDSKAKALKYSYNENPDNYAAWPTKNGTTTKKDAYKGLNREDWEDAKTIFTGAGEYCSVKVDGKGGIHIAAYDSQYGDLKYAYLSSYNSDTYNEYTVDSAGNAGSHMRMDVALASDGTTPIPYISYYGSNMAKLAYPVNGNTTNGAESDMFTGNWEVTYIPTGSEIDDLDYKRLMNVDSRINVGVWKYIDTVTTGDNQHVKGQIKNSTTGTPNAAAGSGKFYGNGTANPLVSYSVLKDTANSRIETAQMQ